MGQLRRKNKAQEAEVQNHKQLKSKNKVNKQQLRMHEVQEEEESTLLRYSYSLWLQM